jgi:hypothetical protein
MKISGADSRFAILGAVLTKTKTVFNFFSKPKKNYPRVRKYLVSYLRRDSCKVILYSGP